MFCVCVCIPHRRETVRDRETDRQRQTDRETDRQRQTDIQTRKGE